MDIEEINKMSKWLNEHIDELSVRELKTIQAAVDNMNSVIMFVYKNHTMQSEKFEFIYNPDDIF